MIHSVKLIPARAWSNKFDSQYFCFGLSSRCVAAAKQYRHRWRDAGHGDWTKYFGLTESF
jgi:hypothetical protein